MQFASSLAIRLHFARTADVETGSLSHPHDARDSSQAACDTRAKGASNRNDAVENGQLKVLDETRD